MSIDSEFDSMLLSPDINDMLKKSSKYRRDDLKQIWVDFESHRQEHEKIVQQYANEISKFDGVHSVRFRVKTGQSLIEKILRKESPQRPKFTIKNYKTEITDLIGVRALYVYPSDYYKVYNQICERYKDSFSQEPCIKIRKGDNVERYNLIDLTQVKIIDEDNIYRSIHYTLKTECGARLEIQTRTIFEEGWSEINHQLAYKKHNDPAISKSIDAISCILSDLVRDCNELGEYMKSLHDQTEIRCELPTEGHETSTSLISVIDRFLKETK